MNETTQVVLVRHGQTQSIIDNRIHGQTDSPLSEKGMQDAERTAQHFRGDSFDAFYSSSLGRAMQTAAFIGKAINMEPTPEDGLKERYYGWLEGRSLKWFEPDYSGPKLTLPLVKFALTVSGESEIDFTERIINTFNTITQRHQGQRILIVLHWGALGVLKQYLLDEDVSIWRTIGPWISCGISEFHTNNGRWHAVYIDKGSHLQ